MRRTSSWCGSLLAAAAAIALLGSFGVVVATPQPALAASSCTSTKGSFVPKTASIAHVGRVHVITVGTNRDGSMGTPPLTSSGKHWLAWYNKSSKPGTGRGGVATDAHTWPDGSALGNAMLRSLHKGDSVALTDGHGHVTCYRVTSRTQYPRSQTPMHTITSGTGHGQTLSIVVCSGKRYGPGNWSDRTVWLAKAIPPPAPPPAPAPAPSPSPAPSGGLLGLGGLGGLL